MPVAHGVHVEPAQPGRLELLADLVWAEGSVERVVEILAELVALALYAIAFLALSRFAGPEPA